MNIKNIKELLKNVKVLYVEDNEDLQKITTKMLKKIFKEVVCTKDGKEALSLYVNNKFDIVITDISIPKINGFELSKKIREINPIQAIIIVSAYSDEKKLLETITLGLDGYLIKPLNLDNLYNVLFKIANNLLNQKQNKFYRRDLERIVKKKINENKKLLEDKTKNYEDTLLALVNLVEVRDSYTAGHSQRVAKYAKMIVNYMNLGEEEEKKIYNAGILHDIGKVAIPDTILLKPNSLSAFEYDLMKKHAILSFEVLNKMPMYKELSLIVKYHHEKFDGSGYPDGLKGNEIPFYSQILAICDTFDAMTTNRIYKPSKNKQVSISEIKSLANKSFSKKLVDIAVKVFETIDIDTNVNQNPRSSIEQHRFAYFYKDKLTNLYNSDYLDFILSKNSYTNAYDSLAIILLHKFNEYNKKYSWEKGDLLLQEFAQNLQHNFKDSLIFRFRGDDFIILSNGNIPLDKSIFEKYNLSISTEYIHLEQNSISSYSSLKNYLDEK